VDERSTSTTSTTQWSIRNGDAPTRGTPESRSRPPHARQVKVSGESNPDPVARAWLQDIASDDGHWKGTAQDGTLERFAELEAPPALGQTIYESLNPRKTTRLAAYGKVKMRPQNSNPENKPSVRQFLKHTAPNPTAVPAPAQG
jgi:hypothetical protein